MNLPEFAVQAGMQRDKLLEELDFIPSAWLRTCINYDIKYRMFFARSQTPVWERVLGRDGSLGTSI